MLTQEQVLQALAKLQIPGEPQGLDTLLGGLKIQEGNIQLALEVSPENAGDGDMETLQKQVEKALQTLPGVTKVQVILTTKEQAPKPPPKAPRKAPPPPQRIPGVACVLAVASGKGGVGKSTLAVNLACALSNLGLKMGLLDADIYGPSLPRMLGMHQKPQAIEGKILPLQAFGIACMSVGFLVDEDAPLIWRGPMVQKALRQMLHQVAWGTLDCLVVDLPPGTGDAQLSLIQQTPLGGCVIISTPQDVALQDARKGLHMFAKLDVPIFGLVENMSYFLCPHCQTRTDVFGNGGAKAQAEKSGVAFLGEIPLDKHVCLASDAGTPIVRKDPTNPASVAFLTVAEKILHQLQTQQPSAQEPSAQGKEKHA